MKVKVTIKGLDTMKKQFISASEDVQRVCSQEVKAMAQDWVAGAVRDAPKDTGGAGLAGAISYKMITDLNAEIVAQRFYAPFMEFGTKGNYKPIPGTEQIAAQFKGYKSGSFMDLLRNIVRWVKRKGITGTYSVKTRRRTGSKINQIAEDYSAAWPIALSIVENGVKPHPFFFKQGDVVWPAGINRLKKKLEKESKVAVIMPGEIRRPKYVTI